MINICNATIIGFIVGFIGDLGLNLSTQKLKILDAGLIDYFPLHGTVEAAFIAAGLVSFCVYISLFLWEQLIKIRYGSDKTISDVKYRYTIIYMFIFGCILDLFFRYLHIMPSLNGMYEKLSIPVSMFFAGGPISISFIILILIETIRNN